MLIISPLRKLYAQRGLILVGCVMKVLLSATLWPGATPAQAPTTVTLRGRVTDARTGEPLGKVKIILVGSAQHTTTDETGQFLLAELPVGELELYVTTVGYGLVKQKVTLTADTTAPLEIALNPEASPLAGEVTVTTSPFEEPETNAASASTLNKAELRTLASVLAGDPIRAAQALPGVAANDDFTSTFTVRGAGFRRIGVFFDGILTENSAHTVHEVQDTGSLSVLNADVIAGLTLYSGAFPAKYGAVSAAALALDAREGNRVKPSGRIAVSLISASAVVDGPIDQKRGAWLVAARKSYLNYFLRHFLEEELETNAFVIDFVDTQSKVVYHLTPAHQVGLTAVIGYSDYDDTRPRNQLGRNTVITGDSRNWLLSGHWHYTPAARLVMQTRFFGLNTAFTNLNPASLPLDDGRRRQWGLRHDTSFVALPAHRLEAGVYLRTLRGRGQHGFQAPGQPPRLITQAEFNERGHEQGYYAQDTWTSNRLRLTLTGGARLDHSALSRQTLVTPRAALAFAPHEGLRLRFGFGQYVQFPSFIELFGIDGTRGLRAERATHYNASVEQMLNNRTRLAAEFFYRRDSSLLFSLAEPLRRNGQLAFISFPWRNALHGPARGVEVSLHRRSANRLTGWLAYAYTTTSLNDPVTGLSFVSDFEQRHTLSTYGSYRLTETVNLSAQWRYGSGFPFPAFFQEVAGQLFLGSERNRVRLPDYSRVDLRFNKAFHFKRSKLTLSGEVLNLLARDNFRYPGNFNVGANGRVFGERQKLLPFLPSAGLAWEF